MDKNLKIWIRLMQVFEKYWGCHQMPERSLFIKGYQFPICARCTGILIGEVIFIISVCFSIYIPFIFSFIMTLPMVIDGLIQLKTKYRSTNKRRLITGLLFGYGFFSLLCYLIAQMIMLFQLRCILF